MDVDTVAKWGPLAQLGACGVLCFIVWRQQRDQTAELKAIRERQAADSATTTAMLALLPKLMDLMGNVQVTMAGLLEHERFRLARKMARDNPPQAWEEETQPFTIAPAAPQKRRSDPMGMPIIERNRGPKGGG